MKADESHGSLVLIQVTKIPLFLAEGTAPSFTLGGVNLTSQSLK
jgi:hypothetical protein